VQYITYEILAKSFICQVPEVEKYVSFARVDLYPRANETHLVARWHDKLWREIPGSSRGLPWPEGLIMGMEDPRVILMPKPSSGQAPENMLVLLWGGGSILLKRWTIWAMGLDLKTLAPVTR
jgi:hypothetical protein